MPKKTADDEKEEFTLTADPPKEEPKDDKKAVKEIIVTQADQWPPASEISGKAEVEISQTRAFFDIKALSHKQLTEITRLYPMPDPPQIKIGRVSRQNTQDPEYLERTGMAQLKRMVHAIELTWHRIEGESIDAKISWVMKNLYRELDLKLLYLEIRRVSGGGLMQLNRDDSNDKVMSISSPSDWAKLSRKETKFRIPHVGHELVFTLRGIPGVKLKEINQECIPPKPPDRPVRTPGTNKIAGIEPDLDNPEYRATCQRLSDQRSLLIIEEALGFTFPGATVADRLAWLGERPCDEVEEIRSFIEYVVASLETRADFFTV